MEIDPHAGFCHGVKKAIEKASDEAGYNSPLYCLGSLVHNRMEMQRLEKMGIQIIDHEQFKKLKNARVLIRTHGEPPETYRIAKENNLEIIDLTCPVVARLQNRVSLARVQMEQSNGQVVILGRKEHPEVIGLQGNADNKAIIVSDVSEIQNIDFSKPVIILAQTTFAPEKFSEIKVAVEEKLKDHNKSKDIIMVDTICRHVTGREKHLVEFAGRHDLLIFVGDPKSSNGRILFELAQSINSKSYFITGAKDIDPAWLTGMKSVGITGSNSTPFWQLQEVLNCLHALLPDAE